LRLYGEEHERVGSALHNVAVANLRANQLSDARDAIEEAVRIRKTALGDDNPKVGDSLVENGIILLSMKQNEQALKVFQEALCVRENEVVKTRDCNDASVRQDAQLKMAKILHNLGCVNFELGHFDDASESCAKALERQKIVFGSWTSFLQRKSESAKPGFLTMASTLCNRAYIGLEQGDYEMALTLLFESLDIQRELLEADNKLIMTTMQNIGHSYCMQSDFHRAREVRSCFGKKQCCVEVSRRILL
jgi:tetratricopeptide (TPR) repeat protein